MKNKGKALAWVGLYMVIALGTQLVIGFALGGVIFMIGMTTGMNPQSQEMSEFIIKITDSVQSGAGLILISALCDLVMLACFGTWYYFRENKYAFRPDYHKAFTGKNICAIVGIGFFGQYVINLLLTLVYFLLPGIFKSYEELSKNFELDTASPLFMIFMVCLFGPLAEELLFRGMIFGKLRRAFSFWPAAVISGLLFGIFHMNWVQGIYAAVFGIVLAYIYEKTQTIWGSCLLHVVFNSSSYLTEFINSWIQKSGSATGGMIILAVELISVGIVVFLLRHFRTRTKG